MATESRQLSFHVGGNAPDTAIVRVSGGVIAKRDLEKGEELHMQIVDMDGEVIADGYGRVLAVTFKDTVDEHGTVTATERVHSAKIT